MKIAHLAVAALALIAAFATPAAAGKAVPVGPVGQAHPVEVIGAKIADDLATVEEALKEAQMIYNRALKAGKATRAMVKTILKLKEKREILIKAGQGVKEIGQMLLLMPPTGWTFEYYIALQRLEAFAKEAGMKREEFNFLRNRLGGALLEK